MFDFRQERFDEIYSAELEFHGPDEPQAKPKIDVAQPGFQLPSSVWALMLTCYAIFFAGMTALVAGSGYALFMVVISALYAVVFFGTGTILANLSGRDDTSPLDKGQPLTHLVRSDEPRRSLWPGAHRPNRHCHIRHVGGLDRGICIMSAEVSRRASELPVGATCYWRSGLLDERSLPAGLQREHRLKEGTWAVLTLLSGSTDFTWDDD